jgi:hypothetical protein
VFILSVIPITIKITTSQEVVEGEAVTLKCEAEGLPPPSIKWLKNKETVAGTTASSSFTINQIRLDDAGVYTCKATNIEESVSRTSKVTVLPKIKFNKRPEDVITLVGSQLVLDCEIEVDPKMSVNSVELHKDGVK